MGLNTLDLAAIVVYLIGVTLFGLRFRGKQRTIKDYFLADNTIPWWAISLSIVAAETSTLTIISVPGLAYEKDFRFLQLVVGYLLGRTIVSFLFIPQYFRGELVTAYQLIERRFGERLRSVTAGLFLVTRAAAEGVRVFAVAIVVRVALASYLTGLSDYGRDVTAIGIVTVLTLVYTFEGGMAAVIWTDVVQLGIYVAGTLVGVLYDSAPGAGRMADGSCDCGRGGQVSHDRSVVESDLYVHAVVGCDWRGVSYDCESWYRSVDCAATAVGEERAAVEAGASVKRVCGAVSVLAVSADRSDAVCVLSTVSAECSIYADGHHLSYLCGNAYAAWGKWIADFGDSCCGYVESECGAELAVVDYDCGFLCAVSTAVHGERRVRLSRISTVCWGVLLFGLALLARNGGKVLEMGLSIASVAYGSLLGVFLLGVLTKRATENGAIVGMVCGFALNVFLWQFSAVAFTWYVVLGSIATFAVGYAASWWTPGRSEIQISIPE